MTKNWKFSGMVLWWRSTSSFPWQSSQLKSVPDFSELRCQMLFCDGKQSTTRLDWVIAAVVQPVLMSTAASSVLYVTLYIYILCVVVLQHSSVFLLIEIKIQVSKMTVHSVFDESCCSYWLSLSLRNPSSSICIKEVRLYTEHFQNFSDEEHLSHGFSKMMRKHNDWALSIYGSVLYWYKIFSFACLLCIYPIELIHILHQHHLINYRDVQYSSLSKSNYLFYL